MDIRALIRKKAIAAGIDPTHALTMASIESGFDPKASNKHGYKGLYQFGPNEWKQWGGGKDIFDPEANIDAFVGYQGQIKDQLKTSLGRDPTPDELYLGWQQGAGGASKLLTNRDALAKTLVSPDAVLANGGDFNMTGGQFADFWRNKYAAHNKTILGQSSGWTGEGDTQESKWIGTAPGSGLLAQPQAQPSTSGGLLDPDYGVSHADSAAAAKQVNDAMPSRSPNYAGVMAAGNSLMQMGMPSGPSGPSWTPQQSPVGRGDPRLAGLLTEIFKRRSGGLLGGY